MKTIHIQSTILLQSVIRKLVESLEVLNKIPEEDFTRIVKAAQKRKPELKKIADNVERANLFMLLFFIRELIQTLNDSDE